MYIYKKVKIAADREYLQNVLSVVKRLDLKRFFRNEVDAFGGIWDSLPTKTGALSGVHGHDRVGEHAHEY